MAERIKTLDPSQYEEFRFDRRHLIKNPQFKTCPLIVNTLRVNDAYTTEINRKHVVPMETSKARALQLELELQIASTIEVLAQVEPEVAVPVAEKLPELALVPTLAQKIREPLYSRRPMRPERSSVA